MRGSNVLVIVPPVKPDPDVPIPLPGWVKLVWLKALYNSPRNSTFIRSNGVSKRLLNARFSVVKIGLRPGSRAMLPNGLTGTPLTTLVVVGSEIAARLMYCNDVPVDFDLSSEFSGCPATRFGR